MPQSDPYPQLQPVTVTATDCCASVSPDFIDSSPLLSLTGATVNAWNNLLTRVGCAGACKALLAVATVIAAPEVEAVEGVPLGFADAAQFQQACAELCSALSESGISDFTIGVRGSSITGTSFSGAPFSAASDIDFFVASPQMTAFPINSYGLVYPSTLNAAYPALAEWSSTWSGILGRGVSVGGFASIPEGPVLVP